MYSKVDAMRAVLEYFTSTYTRTQRDGSVGNLPEIPRFCMGEMKVTTSGLTLSFSHFF